MEGWRARDNVGEAVKRGTDKRQRESCGQGDVGGKGNVGGGRERLNFMNIIISS